MEITTLSYKAQELLAVYFNSIVEDGEVWKEGNSTDYVAAHKVPARLWIHWELHGPYNTHWGRSDLGFSSVLQTPHLFLSPLPIYNALQRRQGFCLSSSICPSPALRW